MNRTLLAGFCSFAWVAAARGQVCDWWVPARPDARSQAAAAFDPLLGRVVMFGGSAAQSGLGVLGDTWLWDGLRWTQHIGTGPAVRGLPALAMDFGIGSVVLFGGTNSDGAASGDTWAFIDSEWRRVSEAGPSPRGGSAMCFDTARRELLLFGGNGGDTYLGDTWAWNGSQWRQVSTSGPLPRYRAAMAFDESRGVAVLYGGTGAAGTFAGTWEWDGVRWSLLAESGPGPRGGARAFYDPIRRSVMLSGGIVQSPHGRYCFGDLWAWDGAAWSLINNAGPLLYDHVAVFDSARGQAVVSGGLECSGTASELATWTFRTQGWTRADDGQTPRGKSVTFHTGLGASVFVGGNGGDDYGGVPGVWTWDGTHSTFIPSANAIDPGNEPPVILPTAYDSGRDVLIAYASTEYGGRVWEWRTGAWTLRELSPAPVEASTPIVYDSHRGVVVLFGGDERLSPRSSRTWEYDGARWTLRTPDGPIPPGRSAHMMAFDSDRNVVVMFGGERDGAPFVHGDTWEYDGAAWTLRSTTGPLPRANASMAYDSTRRRTVLQGGSGPGGHLRDTWEWDGVSWVRRSTDDPGSSYRGSMAYDPGRKRVVAAGFDNDSRVWEMNFPAPRCAADFNGDDFVDFFDYDAFVGAFERGGERADFNRDCFVDFFDYDGFVGAFEQGC